MPQSIDKLFEGVELSEDAKKQVNEAFESAVNEKAKEKADEIVADRVELMEAESKTKIEEAIEEKTSELEKINEKYVSEEVIPHIQEQVNSYLKYVIKEWTEENKLAVDNGIKVELAESIISKNKELLESFGVAVDSDKALDELQESKEQLKKDLDESLAKQTSLAEEKESLEKELVISSVSNELGLTESQKEKLSKLAEKVSYKDKESFGAKVKELSESEFVTDSKEKLEEDKKDDDYSSPYLKSLSESFRSVKK